MSRGWSNPFPPPASAKIRYDASGFKKLVAWWPGFKNGGNTFRLRDYSHKVHHITFSGNVPDWKVVAGRGKVLNFNGTNDNLPHVAVGNTLLDPGIDNFTASVWFRLGAGTGTTRMMISKGHSVSSANIGWIIMITNAGVLTVRCNGSNTTAQRAGQQFSSVTDNDWHLISMVIDRDNDQIRGYLDGSNTGWVAHAAFGDSIAGFGSIDSSQAFRFGATNTPHLFFRGNLDGVRINRRALADAEIRQSFHRPWLLIEMPGGIRKVVFPPITGTLAATLDDATLLSTGGLRIKGQLLTTLDDTTLLSTATLLPVGLAKMAFSSKQPDMTFTSKQPDMTFTSKQPKMTFSTT